MPDAMKQMRRHLRRMIRSVGWDIVRYRPLWPTLLGVERLPIRTVLDIGAYDDDTARIFRCFFPQAHIYCFEPQSEPAQALERWAASQQGMVHVLPFALGNYNGTADLHCNPHTPKWASLTQPWPGHLNGRPDASVRTTPIMRLDAAVSAHIHMADGVLVKVDVEGGERTVLEGGAETLRRCVACIVEFHAVPRFMGQMSFGEGLAVLSEFGLEYGGALQQQVGGGRLQYFDALFINWPRAHALAL